MKRIGMAFTLRAGKYSPLNNDKGLKRISLEKWNGINKDTLFWTYRNEFIVHKRTPALTLTTTKLYPDTLIKYGIKTETRKATGENNVTGMLYYIQQEKSSKSLIRVDAVILSFWQKFLLIAETETFWNEWADVRELFGDHPVSSTDQWSRIEEQIRIPLNISFLNQTYCGSQPLSLVLAHYEAYGKIAPNRRNPT